MELLIHYNQVKKLFLLYKYYFCIYLYSYMYFIIDPTRVDKKTKQDYVATTNNINDFMLYLEGLVERKFGMKRKEFIHDQSDYTGYTENTNEVFYDMLKNHKIVMGQVRKGNLIECDVIRENYYASKKNEHGD